MANSIQKLTLVGLIGLPLLVLGNVWRRQYFLSDDQLKWQGYQADEILRFGHARNGYVRAYRVVKIKLRMRADGSPPLNGFDPDQYQSVTTQVQRTDSAAKPFESVAIGLVKGSYKDDETSVQGYCGWDGLYGGNLLLNEVLDNALSKNICQSSLLYFPDGTKALLDFRSVTLLPSVTLGGITYHQVIYIKSFPKKLARISLKPTLGQAYYARERGMVAFSTDSTDLWYRLP